MKRKKKNKHLQTVFFQKRRKKKNKIIPNIYLENKKKKYRYQMYKKNNKKIGKKKEKNF